MTPLKFWLFFHVISVVIWVGGMFFAYMALRPAAVEVLEPPMRLPLWAATFRRFFPWVWGAVALILISGLIMIGQMGGMGQVPVYVHIMLAVGLAMMAIFAHVFFAPYKRLRRAVAAQDWPSGGKALGQIRMLVGTNLSLGLLNVAIAILGALW